ncbi:MAG: type II secretion system minor pseudopilin GspK [Deferrisomatales bacterium]|nr:type II secretion system minor pseudopilin GspK [Deferrisomatales bacterium]
MRGQRGAALLLVVLLISLLAVLVVEFQREARLKLRSSVNLRDALQAHALLRSGVTVASAFLLADAEESAVDHRAELWSQPIPPVPLGEGTLSVSVEDLDGRFPLGSLVDARGRAVPTQVAAYRRLLDALELEGAAPADLVDALVDWMDEDQEGPYEINPEFTVPNAPLDHLEDLGRVEGYTWEVLHGLLPHVDIRSDRGINVNTATVPVLLSLHEAIRRDEAELLYEELGEQHAERVGDLRTHAAFSGVANFAAVSQNLKVESARFRVLLAADVPAAAQNPVVRIARAVLQRDRAQRTVELVDWIEE